MVLPIGASPPCPIIKGINLFEFFCQCVIKMARLVQFNSQYLKLLDVKFDVYML